MARLNQDSDTTVFRTFDQMQDECDRINAHPCWIELGRWHVVVHPTDAIAANSDAGIEAVPSYLAFIRTIVGWRAAELRRESGSGTGPAITRKISAAIPALDQDQVDVIAGERGRALSAHLDIGSIVHIRGVFWPARSAPQPDQDKPLPSAEIFEPEPGETEWIKRAIAEYGRRFPDSDPLTNPNNKSHFREKMDKWHAAKPWRVIA